jgi:hypothetical protein
MSPAPDAEGEDMGMPPAPDAEGEDMGMPPAEDEEDMEMEDDLETEGGESKVSLKAIQKLTGRLSQKVREYEKEKGMDSQDKKYVLNSLISAINVKSLDDEDRDDIFDKLEQYDDYEDPDNPHTLAIKPIPGYVVKTRRVDESKAFINIYHFEGIVDDSLSLTNEVSAELLSSNSLSTLAVQKAGDKNPPINKSNKSTLLSPQSMTIPVIYFAKPRLTLDKHGSQSSLYNVVISSNYFRKTAEKPSTSPAIVQKVCI